MRYLKFLRLIYFFRTICQLDMGPAKQKGSPRASAKCKDSVSSHACAKSRPGICFPLIVSNDSVSGQRRPCPDCTDAQADLDLRCQCHMSLSRKTTLSLLILSYLAFLKYHAAEYFGLCCSVLFVCCFFFVFVFFFFLFLFFFFICSLHFIFGYLNFFHSCSKV